jgi:arylsulfatase A-like enzyme
MGAHRLIEKGPFTYEQCYRLPLITAYPGCENPGSVCDEFVYLQDLYPTFLEIAGAPGHTEPDTQSILDQIRGKSTPTHRDSIYAQFFAQLFTYEQRMIRTRTHKFVYNLSDMGELYDLEHDPWEMRNLFDLPETHAIQDELKEKMMEHMERIQDPARRKFNVIRHVY